MYCVLYELVLYNYYDNTDQVIELDIGQYFTNSHCSKGSNTISNLVNAFSNHQINQLQTQINLKMKS